jgi:hypothetical protein
MPPYDVSDETLGGICITRNLDSIAIHVQLHPKFVNLRGHRQKQGAIKHP